ncbi:MAG: OsmC family protein [Acidobacteriaceae bacterium]|nr:OsmC family protein [Acidobacteriaceae bacterium]
MTCKVTYETDARCVAETRGHQIIIDQPLDNHGTDEGMTPPELLLASLGTCAMYYAADYLRRNQQPAKGMEVFVDAEKATAPARLGRFTIRVVIPEIKDPAHLEGARRTAEKCLVKNTLLLAPTIELTVETLAAALP